MAVLITGKSVDQLSQEILDDMSVDLESLRARALELKDQSARVCNTSSQYYDAQECARIDAEMQILRIQIKQEYNRLLAEATSITAKEIRGEILDRQRKGTILWAISNINGIGQLLRI